LIFLGFTVLFVLFYLELRVGFAKIYGFVFGVLYGLWVVGSIFGVA